MTARIAAVAAIAAAIIGVWAVPGGQDPPPAECGALHATALELRDITVVYQMTALGCPDPPYDAIDWP